MHCMDDAMDARMPRMHGCTDDVTGGRILHDQLVVVLLQPHHVRKGGGQVGDNAQRTSSLECWNVLADADAAVRPP